MKILFKRNSATTSTIPASLTAGEPLWFKDVLYIGSTGQHGIANGPASGDLQRIVDGNTDSGGTLTLSKTEAKYLSSGPYEWKIKLPDSDPYTSARTPTSHDHGYIINGGYIEDSNAYISSGTFSGLVALAETSPTYGPIGILVNVPKDGNTIADSAIRVLEMGGNNKMYLSGSGTFEDIPTGFNAFSPANSTSTGKLTRNHVSVIAGAPAATVTISGGNKWIDLAGDNTAGSKTVTIGHAGPGTDGAMITAGSSADQSGTAASLTNGGSFDVPMVSWDAAGHITSVTNQTLNLPNIRSTDLYCASASDVRNKNATAAIWPGIEGWYRLVLVNDNIAVATDTTAVTLSVNGGTSYPIRLNGTLITTSTVNRNIPAGVYDVYFTGDEWRIISRFYGNASNAIVCNSDGGILSKYAGSASPFTPNIGNYPMFFANTNDINGTTLRINGTLYANNKLHVLSSNGWKDVTKTYSWPSGWSYPYFDGTDWWFTDTGKMIAAGYAVPNGLSTGFLKSDGSVDSSSYVTVEALNSAIGDMTGAMVYRDSVTRTTGSSPAWSFGSGTTPDSANQGDVYVVSAGFSLSSATVFIASGKTIPAGNYESGDMIIYNGSAWNVINGENQVVVTSGGAELTVPATNTAGSAVTVATVDGTDVQVKLKHDTSGVTAASYGESTEDNSTLGYGGSLHIPYITVNTAGHVTAASTKTIKLPAASYSFSIISAGGYNSDTTSIFGNVAAGRISQADQAGDTITIQGFNRWIKTGVAESSTAENDILYIGHTGPGDGGDMISAKTKTTNGTGENSSAIQTAVMGQAFKIPYLAYDAAGHITETGTKDVTLPSWNTEDNYAFKTITPANSSNTVTDLTGDTTSLVADSNTDTLNIKGYNKWIVLSGTNNGTGNNVDTLNIAHKTATAYSAGFYKVTVDEAGHVTTATAVAASDITTLLDGANYLGNGAFQIAVGSTTKQYGTANQSSPTTVTFSSTAVNGKFSISGENGNISIQLDEIDGGLV